METIKEVLNNSSNAPVIIRVYIGRNMSSQTISVNNLMRTNIGTNIGVNITINLFYTTNSLMDQVNP